MVLKWRFKRVVTVLPTIHNHKMDVRKNKSGNDQVKPVVVFVCNKQLKGVNLRDQMLHSFLLERKRGLKVVYTNFQKTFEHFSYKCLHHLKIRKPFQ
jgi:hypothetical protein